MYRFFKLYDRTGVFILIIVEAIILAIFAPHFLEAETILNILTQSMTYIVLGLGMTMVLTSGGFDLSLEGIISVSAVVFAYLTRITGFPQAILASLSTACLIGFLNGFIITRLKVNPFIATFSMWFVLQGAAFLISGAKQITILRKEYMQLGVGKTLYIPNTILISLIALLVFYILLHRTPFGRHIVAIGSNEPAAELSGLNIVRIKTLVYVIFALTCGIVSLIRVSQSMIGVPRMSQGYLLFIFTVSVLGGTDLYGGKPNIIGTFFAGIFIAMTFYGLNLLRVEYNYQLVALGGILVFALFINGLRNRYLSIMIAKGVKG